MPRNLNKFAVSGKAALPQISANPLAVARVSFVLEANLQVRPCRL